MLLLGNIWHYICKTYIKRRFKILMTNRKNMFPSTDWFDLHFLADFVNSKSENKLFLSRQQFTIGQERISSRLLNSWYQAGIVKDDRPKGKGWKKFSLSEIVWIHIIHKLRNFGLDLHRIKKVKDEIDRYNQLDKESQCSLLDFYILLSANSKTPIKFIVFESGEADIVRQIDIDLANELKMIEEDFITIDLNKLMNKLVQKKGIKTDYLGYSALPQSEISKQIENSLSAKDIESLTIKVKGTEYIVDEEYFFQDRTEANALSSALRFGRIVENISSGKSSFQVTSKKKIKREAP